MRHIFRAILLISVFIGCHFFMRYLWGGAAWTDFLTGLDHNTSLIYKPVIYLFLYGPLVLCAYLLFRHVGWADILGIKHQGAVNYLYASLVCCAPMFLGYAWLSTELHYSIIDLMLGSVYAGFFEEVIFRAVLFGVLFRYCKLGFIPAALVSALVFGLGHIYQGNDLSSAILAFTITAIAGAWFSWLYCECGHRIWFPMWMHIFMNGAYYVFGMSGGAVGQLEANIFKGTAIILTLVYVHMLIRKGKPRAITKHNLWLNKSDKKQMTSLATE